jgi:hypothetical protein
LPTALLSFPTRFHEKANNLTLLTFDIGYKTLNPSPAGQCLGKLLAYLPGVQLQGQNRVLVVCWVITTRLGTIVANVTGKAVVHRFGNKVIIACNPAPYVIMMSFETTPLTASGLCFCVNDEKQHYISPGRWGRFNKCISERLEQLVQPHTLLSGQISLGGWHDLMSIYLTIGSGLDNTAEAPDFGCQWTDFCWLAPHNFPSGNQHI